MDGNSPDDFRRRTRRNVETKTRNQTSQNKNFIDFLITIEVFSFFEDLNQTVKGQKKKEIRTCSFFSVFGNPTKTSSSWHFGSSNIDIYHIIIYEFLFNVGVFGMVVNEKEEETPQEASDFRFLFLYQWVNCNHLWRKQTLFSQKVGWCKTFILR